MRPALSDKWVEAEVVEYLEVIEKTTDGQDCPCLSAVCGWSPVAMALECDQLM